MEHNRISNETLASMLESLNYYGMWAMRLIAATLILYGGTLITLMIKESNTELIVSAHSEIIKIVPDLKSEIEVAKANKVTLQDLAKHKEDEAIVLQTIVDSINNLGNRLSNSERNGKARTQ